MARKKSKYPHIENLEITDIAAEGKSLGRVDDKIVFVTNTVPGDIVDVQINSSRRRFMEAYVTEYKVLSPMRAEPFCEHFGECGGCKWQALPYQKQLDFKQTQVLDQLSRIGKIELPEIMPIIGSDKTTHYRNKLEYTFSNKRWIPRTEMAAKEDEEIPRGDALGFHIPGMFDKIIDINTCHLQAEPSNAIRLSLKEFSVNNNLEFYDLRTHEGLMRNLVIRTSTTGQVMVIVVFAKDAEKERIAVMEHLKTSFPEITSLGYIINTKLNDSMGDQTVIIYSGKPYMEEKMENLTFRINPKSFYQTNSEQALELYKVTRDFAELSGNETLYDLYTGTGTIANFVAKGCKKVVGVEYVPEAIEDAKINSQINDVHNTTFFAGDMKDVLNDEFIAQHGKPDVIILDPPRAGIHEDVAKVILNAEPQIIVYVSCNPATQARDLAIFDEKYIVTKVQPVDMFPHTHHVENVVQLFKREHYKTQE